MLRLIALANVVQGAAETESIEKYAPYACVKNRSIRAHFCHVAKLFQYLDHGFAEYFQVAVSRLPRPAVESYLQSARRKVAKQQARGQHEGRLESTLNLGDLGNFCEKVLDEYTTYDEGRVLYEVTDCTQEELLHYLQDSFEVPYWKFMLDLFLQNNVNSRSLSATVVFRVLSSIKIEVLHRKDMIRRSLAASKDNCGEDIEPLMKGIDAHIAVLEDVWHKDTSELEGGELFQTLFGTLEPNRPPSPEGWSATPDRPFSAWPENQQSSPKVNRTVRIPMIGQRLTFFATRTL